MPIYKALLIALDQCVNALFGGYPDETISSRAWRWHVARIRSWPMHIIDTIFFWEDRHCKISYESERNERHFPPELRY